ncbi:MAG: hypothetical protein LBG57_06060 [Treponema sp.]|nr:hypothetical protein [Treponema sp.]
MEQKGKKISEMEAIRGRKEKRYLSSAQVIVGEDELQLKNISRNGGCVQARDFIDLMPNGAYTFVIVPEEESRLESFEVNILVRWMRIRRNGLDTGFIMTGPSGAIENYIDFSKLKENTGTIEVFPKPH